MPCFHLRGQPSAGDEVHSARMLNTPPQSFEEAGQIVRHRWHQETAIQEEVPHFAARFGDQQAAMARGAVGRSIAAPVVRFMIGANRII